MPGRRGTTPQRQEVEETEDYIVYGDAAAGGIYFLSGREKGWRRRGQAGACSLPPRSLDARSETWSVPRVARWRQALQSMRARSRGADPAPYPDWPDRSFRCSSYGSEVKQRKAHGRCVTEYVIEAETMRVLATTGRRRHGEAYLPREETVAGDCDYILSFMGQ